MGVTEVHAIFVKSMYLDKSTMLCVERGRDRVERKLFYCFNTGRFIVFRVKALEGVEYTRQWGAMFSSNTE